MNRSSTDAPYQVVLAWAYQEWGGVQTHLLTLAGSLSKRGHCVRALVPSEPAPALRRLAAENGVELIEFGPPIRLDQASSFGDKLQRRRSDIVSHQALLKAARRLDPKPDFFHVDLPPWNSIRVVLALLRLGPVVQTFHTPMATPGRTIRDAVLRARYRFLATRRRYRVHSATTATAESLRPWIGSVPVDITGVCDFAAADAVLRRDRTEVRAEFAIPVERVVLGTLGQLIDRKGLDVLLRAAASLRGRGFDAHVLLGGDGVAGSELRSLANQLGFADFLTIAHPDQLGNTHADHLRVLHACDVVVLPSREEGLPLTLLEALCLGRPCVVTPVGAIPAEFNDPTHVRFAPVDDIDATATVVAAVLDDESEATAMGQRGSRKVRESFDPDAAASVHLAAVSHLPMGRKTQRNRVH